MKNYRLLTDMDDVLENLLENWVELLKFQQRNNPDYIHKTAEEITSWDMQAAFPMLSADEIYAPLNTDIIWKMIKPIEGAAEILKKYNSLPNVDVRLVTSSHYSSIPAKREFLRKYFPFIRWNQIIIAGHGEKQYVLGNVLIDDYEGNLVGGEYKGLLFDTAHNRHFDVSKYPSITRVQSWDDIDKWLKKDIKRYFSKEKDF